jgi:hypothetical protein
MSIALGPDPKAGIPNATKTAKTAQYRIAVSSVGPCH